MDELVRESEDNHGDDAVKFLARGQMAAWKWPIAWWCAY